MLCETTSFLFCNYQPPWMFLPLDPFYEYWIERIHPPQSSVDNIPKLPGPKTPLISPLKISTKGVEKWLAGINAKKASGPDNIPCKILRELAAELAPILTTIFQQSLETGQIPVDWTLAFVSPFFKNGNRNLLVNYRPVYLTSVPCKIMEHIICSHVRDHLDKHSVLTSL